jgi:hypothetical protein
MEFLASDMEKPWRLCRTKLTTREAGLKRLPGSVRRNVPVSRAIIGALVWIEIFRDRVE